MAPAAVFVLAAGATVFAGTQPQLAASGDQVYVAFGAGNVISVARSDDSGATFGPPVALPMTGVLALGRHRGPRVAATPEAVLVAAVVGAKGGGADGDLVVYRSTDRGRTWGRPVPVNHVPGAAREGLHALAASPSGLVVVAWLDLRASGTRLYAATSRDHGATWSPDRLVYASPSGTICQCCHPSIAVAADGRILVMFRNSLDGRRDMYVTESRDGVAFTPAVKQGRGSWTLAACPMDGGAVVPTPRGVASVWRREAQVYLAAGDGPETALGAGQDPAATASDAGVDVAWASPAGIVLRQAGTEAVTLGPGRFPVVAAVRTGTLVAWEDQARVHVRTVPRAAAVSATPAGPR